jgi:exonuclease III
MNEFPQFTAKVAVWNIAGFHTISAERRKKQALALKILDAEFVTLIEVRPISYIEDLVAELNQDGNYYEYAIAEQNADLNIGFIFKRGVEVTNLEFISGSDLNNDEYRRALMADVKIGALDFKVIGVHLKSGRGSDEQKIRDSQCQVIAEKIEELRDQSREDILLLGDFNMIPGQDVSNFHYLGGEDTMDFVSSWDLQDRYSHILEQGRANLLDGYAISRTYFTEYIRGSLQLFPMHWTLNIGREAFRDEVSDHLPFVASFRIISRD